MDDTKQPHDEPKSKQQSKLNPPIALVGALTIFFGAQILGVNLMVVIGVLLGKNQQQAVDWFTSSIALRSFTLLLITIVGLAAVRWLLKLTKTSRQQIGLKKPVVKDIGYAAIGYGWYFLMFLIVMALTAQFLTGVNVEQQQNLGFERSVTSPLSLIFIGFSLVVLPAIYEEILIRGVLFTGFRRKLGFATSLILVSVIFASAHLEWGGGGPLNWAAAIDTGVLSIVLVYLREKTGSLWASIFLHGTKNFIAFCYVFVFKQGNL